MPSVIKHNLEGYGKDNKCSQKNSKADDSVTNPNTPDPVEESGHTKHEITSMEQIQEPQVDRYVRD